MDQIVLTKSATSSIAEYVAALDANGYVIIPQAFDEPTIGKARDLTRFWFKKTINEQSERMPRLNRDQPMVYNLQNKDIFFCKLILENPIIEGVLTHFLNDKWFTSLPADAPNYILRSYLARSSNYKMPMHIDSFVPYMGSYPFIMQCAILLEDQTVENGCTVLVPRSHKSGEYADQGAFNTAIPIEAKAGDLVLWDSRIWHGAGENLSGGTRWSIIATFCRWWIKQAFDIPGNLPQDIYDQLSNRQKAVMGYCSVPYDDEAHGIDMKRDFALLPAKVANYRF